MSLRGQGLGHRVPGPQAQRWLYRGLDFELARGSITTIVGPNGAGKTTLLRDLAGLSPPTEGCVDLDGRTLQSLPLRERARRIAYLPQLTPLYHDLRVVELVMLGRAPHLPRFGQPSADDHNRAREALERVGLSGFEQRGVFSLSGGEYQRAMLARMLVTEADILVLDEPTASLDVGHAMGFLELCRELAGQGRTLIAAIHDLELARRYSGSVVCLSGADNSDARVGSVAEVMVPDLLAEVFDVGVELTDAGLRFSPR